MQMTATFRGSSKRRREGSAAIEFAMVGPLLILMLMGMVVYGGWFWMAQSVQSLASEAARAAVGGMDDAERQSLATGFVVSEAAGSGLNPAKLSATVETDASAIRVKLTLDARDSPFLTIAPMLPPPPNRITRTAVVRIGGY